MSGFHESIKSLISDVERFIIETLKNEKLSKSAKSQKQEIIDKITKLKEEYPALGTVNVSTDHLKPSKDTAKDDESSRTGGSSNADESEDPYADSCADIPNVPAVELTNFTTAGYLEKKRPGIGLRTTQKRWCVIKGNIFYYFDSNTSKKMKGAFRLTDYSFNPSPEMTKDEKKKELCFKLVRPANRTYEFMAISKKDYDDWKTAVDQASKVVPVVEVDNTMEDDGDIYEPVGEGLIQSDDPGELYDDGETGDIYEAEPASEQAAQKESLPELEQDETYDCGFSAPIQEETYEDAASPAPPTPPGLPPSRGGRARPPPPPVPVDDEPYQSRPAPPARALPMAPVEVPVQEKTPEKVPEEPKSYRNEEDFENMYIGKWDCSADNEKELSFKKGDIIYIINRDYDDKSWWIGELNGQFGLVPKNYLTEAYETLTF